MPAAHLLPVDRSTVVDRLTDSLIDAVVTGRFDVGAPLPPERELAERFEVNRATLRQAVGRLEQIGLLTRRQGSGTIVCDPRKLTAPEVVGRIATADDAAFVADLVEVREALAEVIGRRAAGAITEARRAVLGALIDQIAEATTARERQLLELRFFAVLVDAAGNRAIEVLLRWVEQVYDTIALPSIAPAFADAAVVLGDLQRLLTVIDTGGDLAAGMVDYARATGARLVAAVEAR